jgi:hypothetical protein
MEFANYFFPAVSLLLNLQERGGDHCILNKNSLARKRSGGGFFE